MKRIGLLIFLGCWISVWAAEGIVGFPESSIEPNDAVAETKTEEPNVIELVPIEPIDVIELTAACDILRPKYHLLPLKTELIAGESLPIYLNVFHKDPNHPESEPDFDLVEQLLKQNTEANDIKAMGHLLEKHTAKLNLLRKANLCKAVEWPVTHYEPKSTYHHMDMMMPGTGNFDSPELPDRPEEEYEPVIFTPSEYLDFLENIQQYGKLVALKARYHILKHDYDEALIWLRTGLAISRQMVQNSNAQLGVMAAANAAVSLQQIELWTQTPNSPGLYRSLQDLPLPFLNAYSLPTLVEKELKQKMPRFGMPYYYEETVKKENSLIPYYSSELPRNASNRIDRFIAILECLEGLRYYAALYDGKLPNSLGEVTEIRLPNDPITKGSFLYHKESDAAILQALDTRNNVSLSGFCYTIRMRPNLKD